WLHWDLGEEQQQYLEFVKKVVRIFQTQPVFQRRKFFKGRSIRGSDIKDISWLDPSGKDMTDEAWSMGSVRCLGVRLAGALIGDGPERGEPIVGDTILMLLNTHHEAVPFTLPLAKAEHHWERLLDTTEAREEPLCLEPSQTYPLEARSLAV